jgi:hypothetical protein
VDVATKRRATASAENKPRSVYWLSLKSRHTYVQTKWCCVKVAFVLQILLGHKENSIIFHLIQGTYRRIMFFVLYLVKIPPYLEITG